MESRRVHSFWAHIYFLSALAYMGLFSFVELQFNKFWKFTYKLRVAMAGLTPLTLLLMLLLSPREADVVKDGGATFPLLMF